MSEAEARRALARAQGGFKEAHVAFEQALFRREGVKEAIARLIEAEATLRAARLALAAARRGERDGPR